MAEIQRKVNEKRQNSFFRALYVGGEGKRDRKPASMKKWTAVGLRP